MLPEKDPSAASNMVCIDIRTTSIDGLALPISRGPSCTRVGRSKNALLLGGTYDSIYFWVPTAVTNSRLLQKLFIRTSVLAGRAKLGISYFPYEFCVREKRKISYDIRYTRRCTAQG
jgi:hypothetical protein